MFLSLPISVVLESLPWVTCLSWNMQYCHLCSILVSYPVSLRNLYSCKTMIVVNCDVIHIHKSMWSMFECFLWFSGRKYALRHVLMVLRIMDKITEVCCWSGFCHQIIDLRSVLPAIKHPLGAALCERGTYWSSFHKKKSMLVGFTVSSSYRTSQGLWRMKIWMSYGVILLFKMTTFLKQ